MSAIAAVRTTPWSPGETPWSIAQLITGGTAARPPVLLVHGDQDQVVPPEALLFSAQGLGALRVPVEFHMSRGIGHGIDGEGLTLGVDFLVKAFDAR